MTYQTLLFETRDGIAFVTVNRPDKLNALNDQVMAELADAVERITTTPDVRGALITGAGPKLQRIGQYSVGSRRLQDSGEFRGDHPASDPLH